MSSSMQSRASSSPRSTAPPAPPETAPVQPASLESLLRELRSNGAGQSLLGGAGLESALESIWAHRLRSLLTVLGVVIGITAVIGAMTLTQGVGAYLDNLIASQGANTVFVQPGAANSRGVRTKQASQTLTVRDVQTLSHLPHVAAISPFVDTGGQVVYGNQNWKTRVQGVSTDLQTIQSWDLAEGFWFSQQQDAGGSAVAVIGDTVAQNLFKNAGIDPVGQQIRINNALFRVVGVLAPRGGPQEDDVIFVPYKAAMARLTNQSFLNEIDVQADSEGNVNLVQQEVTRALEQNHQISRGQPDDFQTITSAQILQDANEATQAITVLLVGIAAISLTVGGIGIMNIMLVSVTERTREIGIRLTVGARRSDIRNQFLIEALLLCVAGGIIGLLLGVLVGWQATGAIALAASGGRASGINIPLVITAVTIILPFAVSVGIGLIFGIYPAVRAARLDPIVALGRTAR
ncbi:MAG TPA: ABC transporter permease [Ktedonobacteraceae bacterium]|nr:ABC transporter permease [Ktedonobacteraceae bacterium]